MTWLIASVCVHGAFGAAERVDWDSASRRPDRVEARLDASFDVDAWLDETVDTGLPRATATRTWRAPFRVPQSILIDEIEDVRRFDGVRLATRGRRRDLIAAGAGLATPEFCEVFGIRAWPARIEPDGREAVIHEGP